MHLSKRLKGIQGENYKVELEYNKDYIIIHFGELTKVNKAILKELNDRLVEWFEFFATLGVQYLWAAVPPDNQEINKLAVLLGFKYVDYNAGFNIYRYGD